MKVLRVGLEERIRVRVDKLRSSEARKYFLTHLDYPSLIQVENKNAINLHLNFLNEELPNIKDLLKLSRKHIQNIWDKTKFSATYLLIGKSINNLEVLVKLAKDGASHEVVEVARSAVESLDLVFLFLEDDEEKLLKKWFKGKIISNDDARVAYQKIINKENHSNESAIPIKDVKSDVYGVYSLYTHSSYSALLDLVDVFYEDFDYKKYSSFHYTRKYLHLIDNVAINILLGLKNMSIRMNDIEFLKKVEDQMKKMKYENIPKKNIEELFKPYKNNS